MEMEIKEKSKKEIDNEKTEEQDKRQKEETENYKQFAYRVKNPFRGV